jgi:hypothetical protein
MAAISAANESSVGGGHLCFALSQLNSHLELLN